VRQGLFHRGRMGLAAYFGEAVAVVGKPGVAFVGGVHFGDFEDVGMGKSLGIEFAAAD